jgi:hypothetical protein
VGERETPFIAAAWRADPLLPPNFGSAPLARRYLTAVALPKYAERNSGVSPEIKTKINRPTNISNLPSRLQQVSFMDKAHTYKTFIDKRAKCAT